MVGNNRAWWWLFHKWKENERRTGSRAALAAAANQIHSWLPRASAAAGLRAPGIGGPELAAALAAAALWVVARLILLCTSPCLTEQERSHCAAAVVLSFSSSCCFIGRLTLRLTLAYFLPYAFPKAALVPGAS